MGQSRRINPVAAMSACPPIASDLAPQPKRGGPFSRIDRLENPPGSLPRKGNLVYISLRAASGTCRDPGGKTGSKGAIGRQFINPQSP